MGRARGRYLHARRAEPSESGAGGSPAGVPAARSGEGPGARGRAGAGARGHGLGGGPARTRTGAQVNSARRAGPFVLTAAPSADFTFISSLAGARDLSEKGDARGAAVRRPVPALEPRASRRPATAS